MLISARRAARPRRDPAAQCHARAPGRVVLVTRTCAMIANFLESTRWVQRSHRSSPTPPTTRSAHPQLCPHPVGTVLKVTHTRSTALSTGEFVPPGGGLLA